MKRNLILLAVCLLTFSCSKPEKDESDYVVHSRVLESWLRENNYTNPERTERGVVFLDKKQGDGAVITDTSFVFLHYYNTDLYGNIISSNYKSIDVQLGNDTCGVYYGPKVYRMGNGILTPGIEEALLGMREGAEITVALPAKFSLFASGLKYTAGSGKAINMIYHVKVDKVVEFISDYEISQLEAYKEKFFPQADTLLNGVYFLKNNSLPDADSIASNTNMKVRYIGRMLDGTVFDTNIADSAKFYRIYNSEKNYTALEILYCPLVTDMLEKEETIPGFIYAVHEMKKGESGTVFFWSYAGYQDQEQSNIPGYSQLRFDIWIEQDK